MVKENNRKIAICILAHKDQNQLKRLVYSLDDDRFDFFIHIDKKKDINGFKFNEYKVNKSKVILIKNRVKVYWGDYSIVQATLNMYEEAINYGEYYRFVLLSGLDYPILSTDAIYEKLTNNNDEFIMGNKIEPKDYHKIIRYHFLKMHKIIPEKLTQIAQKILRIKKKNQVMINGKLNDVYFAPQWQALTGDCVKEILKTVKDNKKLVKYFKHSYAPDELLIPTIVFNSEKFSENVLKNYFPINTHYNEKTATHFINYEPNVQVMTEKDYNDIVNSKKMFFRKAVSNYSDSLIEMIKDFRKEGKNG